MYAGKEIYDIVSFREDYCMLHGAVSDAKIAQFYLKHIKFARKLEKEETMSETKVKSALFVYKSAPVLTFEARRLRSLSFRVFQSASSGYTRSLDGCLLGITNRPQT